MKREFLKNLGIEDALIDQILDENSRDIGREKQKADTARTDLATTQEKLKTVESELETLKQSNGDTAKLQKDYDELKAKYDTDTAALSAQLADRDYSDAITRAIAGKALKFSSKSAEKAFTAALKEKKLELKDGELTGIDDFIKEQREADPDAFAPDKPAPRFTTGNNGGGSGEPPEHVPENIAQAKAIGAARAANNKATNDIMQNYL